MFTINALNVVNTLDKTCQISTRPWLNGIRILLKFPNGFGASIIDNDWSYGIELAFVKFYPNSDNFNIIYAEPFIDGIVGYIKTEEELEGYLEQIRELPEDYYIAEGE